MRPSLLLLAILLLPLAACGGDSSPATAPSPATPTPATATAVVTPSAAPRTAPATTTTAPTAAAAAFTLSAAAFANGANIPADYSCDGKSSSPELSWTGAPANTKSFALVMHDPDAPRSGGFTHWVLYNIPATASRLEAAAAPGGTLPPGTLEGQNGSGRPGYTGPCPPKGGAAHHYQFTLYALDATLALPAGKSKDDLEAAIKGHILTSAQIVGLFAH